MLTSYCFEIPYVAIIQSALPAFTHWGNCYIILILTVQLKGKTGHISVHCDGEPFAFLHWWYHFSVVHGVVDNWTAFFKRWFPDHNNGAPWYDLGRVDNSRNALKEFQRNKMQMIMAIPKLRWKFIYAVKKVERKQMSWGKGTTLN